MYVVPEAIFFFVCVGSLLRMWAFSSCGEWGLLLLQSTGSRRMDFSSCSTRAQQLRSTGSRVHGLSSCGSQVLLLRGMWDLPRPGIKLMFPALAGGFLTTAPPGKSPQKPFLNQAIFMVNFVVTRERRNIILNLMDK